MKRLVDEGDATQHREHTEDAITENASDERRVGVDTGVPEAVDKNLFPSGHCNDSERRPPHHIELDASLSAMYAYKSE